MSLSDYEIMATLAQGSHRTEINGMTVDELAEITKYSQQKIRRSIRTLITVGYVMKGASRGHKGTYYITHDGLSKLNAIQREMSL